MKNATEAAGRLSLSLNGLATDLDTEHGGTDANKRYRARQVGRLNFAGLQLRDRAYRGRQRPASS
jgi:hypothetical protein